MKVIVCGSRKWTNREAIANRLFDLPAGSRIVHGNAQGADRIAHQEAEKLGHYVEPWDALWDLWGKRAGPIRNEAMAKAGADLCIAFWDGSSRGTQHMVDMAEKYDIPLELHCEGRP